MNIKYLNMIFFSILINGDINIREVVEAMWIADDMFVDSSVNTCKKELSNKFRK